MVTERVLEVHFLHVCFREWHWNQITKQRGDGRQRARGEAALQWENMAFTGRYPLIWTMALLLSSCVTGRGNSVAFLEHFLLYWHYGILRAPLMYFPPQSENLSSLQGASGLAFKLWWLGPGQPFV